MDFNRWHQFTILSKGDTVVSSEGRLPPATVILVLVPGPSSMPMLMPIQTKLMVNIKIKLCRRLNPNPNPKSNPKLKPNRKNVAPKSWKLPAVCQLKLLSIPTRISIKVQVQHQRLCRCQVKLLSIPTPHAGQAFSKEQWAEAGSAGDASRPAFIGNIGLKTICRLHF
jgi:hypothetical protein